MTEASRQPKDKNYNLITVLHQSADNVESLKTYIQDAQAEGDQELVEFFSGVLENNLEAAQRAKEMLVPRLQSDDEGPVNGVTDTVGGVTEPVSGLTDKVGGVTDTVRGTTDKLLGGGGKEKQR
ncbi:MAG: hypothetical protein AVDCRST_MAG58-226 [uncultured Rubrobacteraceae bacterium]|uniref:Uncharacterized protein n=1 Tax=uncultured Rubrobacteraceae bacterium TaxID=349277 RepID=A0A6J4QJJ0_9ACTN|nr:MAG: hypothetical protein AVDCRST_MAG58-226 [uncultured Rubrobacteraceae bacterium]